MKLLVFVLNDIEKLGPVLKKLGKANYKGATVIPSKGMAVALGEYFDGSLLASLYSMMSPDHEENRTVFMVLKEEDAKRAIEIIEEEAGSFDKPNAGIAFILPVDFVKGI